MKRGRAAMMASRLVVTAGLVQWMSRWARPRGSGQLQRGQVEEPLRPRAQSSSRLLGGLSRGRNGNDGGREGRGVGGWGEIVGGVAVAGRGAVEGGALGKRRSKTVPISWDLELDVLSLPVFI